MFIYSVRERVCMHEHVRACLGACVVRPRGVEPYSGTVLSICTAPASRGLEILSCIDTSTSVSELLIYLPPT